MPSDLTVVPVSTSTGAVEISPLSAALRPETCLVTVMLANNETGVVQPIREISDAIREKQFHNTLGFLAIPSVRHEILPLILPKFPVVTTPRFGLLGYYRAIIALIHTFRI